MTTSSATLMVFVSDKLTCIKILGRANFATSLDFKALVNGLLQKGITCFVLDLSECMLMDSTFLGVLAGFGLKTNTPQNVGTTGQSIELMNPNSRVTELLENLGVLHLFRVVSGPAAEKIDETSGEAAVASINPTREEVVTNCLEAHKLLMALDPANVPKFKEVTQFLAEDLKKIQNAPSS